MLYVGEGLRGSNGACSTLHWISVTRCATHHQIGPLWCWFPSGWACAHSRPLWVSPTTSPVSLGVTPAAAPIPMGAFNQRSEALFPRAGALGYTVCFAPHRSSWFICARMWGLGVLPTALPAPFSATLSPALSVYLCVNVGLQGLLVVRLPALFIPHSPGLGPTRATWVLSAPCLSPPLLPVWMYVSFLSTLCRTSLPFDFLSVLVVRGGAVCLPMPPSWFSIWPYFSNSTQKRK